jgi:predicted GH43/DUF377 family glycosyl hydrolase
MFKGPEYFHILYGGYDGKTWRIGHVRTKDFRTFEPNPYNPVFMPAENPDAWDCDGVLTAQIFEVKGTYYMLYAGKRGGEWQTGLAICFMLVNEAESGRPAWLSTQDEVMTQSNFRKLTPLDFGTVR